MIKHRYLTHKNTLIGRFNSASRVASCFVSSIVILASCCLFYNIFVTAAQGSPIVKRDSSDDRWPIHKIDFYPGLSNIEFSTIIADVIEGYPVGASEKHLVKWPGDISIAVILDDQSEKLYAVLAKANIALIRESIGNRIITDPRHVNFVVLISSDILKSLSQMPYIAGLFRSKEEYRLFSDKFVLDKEKCTTHITVSSEFKIQNYFIALSTNQKQKDGIDCLNWSIYSGFGMKYRYRSTIVQQKNIISIYNGKNKSEYPALITKFDREILGILYSKGIESGTTVKSVREMTLNILDDRSGNMK
jgi:hypothetical protein